MDLSHEFTVPIGVAQTWEHFGDIAAVAECFPGAQVTSAEGDSFAGSVKVKLGPIAMQYNGSGTFVEKDESARRFVVEAKGKDKRGNGTAGATVTVAMSGDDSSTTVTVDTDLAVTGRPAQFGRGFMQDVSDKLLAQFVACLEQRLGAPAAVPETVPEEGPEEGVTDAVAGGVAGQPAQAGPAASTRAAADSPSAPDDPDTALDLGAAVLPVLAKSYWKQALGALAGLLVLKKLLGRR